jgi:hypothetical protein
MPISYLAADWSAVFANAGDVVTYGGQSDYSILREEPLVLANSYGFSYHGMKRTLVVREGALRN